MKRLFLSIVLIIGLFANINMAEPIEVENFSFELPNAGKQTGFDDVPGWSTDSAVTDSGVETGWTPTEGDWTAFLMSGDPSVWQLTDHRIIQGDVFELKLDARITWQATTLQMILYYDDNGARIPAASTEVTLSDTMEEYTLLFSSNDVPASAGHQIGIELLNSSSGDTWIGMDNVRLELIAAGKPTFASDPKPENGQTEVPVNIILSWTPGELADKHDIYLGTNFNDVNDATPTDDPNNVYLGRFDPNSYPESGSIRLEFGRIYYWRVDEVNAPPDDTFFKGDIWSFTVESYAIAISEDNITATASSWIDGEGPENTINNSGLDVNDLHSTDLSTMWVTENGQTTPVWIQYEFDKPYKLHEMLVWNYNGQTILSMYGLKEVSVEYSTDGANWNQVPDVSEFTKAPGTRGYAGGITVPFDGVVAKYVRITATSNWSTGIFAQYGLSEVRFMCIPTYARQPNPDNDTIDIAIDTILNWRAGREAVQHYVYLSADEQAIANGTASPVTMGQNSYGPLSLDMGSIYYWRVDEVNNAQANPLWQGDIWTFATQEYLVVDDFESYNDVAEGQEGSNLVYLTWLDGYDNPSVNGSTMGYASGASMETTIVHSGGQSVPLTYDNSAASSSVVTVSTDALDIGRNWTGGGAETLVLWFYGDPNNAA
ncbi:MAG: discoidin domain-containing protein, partial [Sedimentisphaerales bacterium]|nr:discoidin domain-containing protein [Sedimentisphaerales bacterium]